MLRKRLKNKKGFTLAELLIVVAIIAVLVAISIPIFTTQLRKARLATNQSNARAAYAAATADYLVNDDTAKTGNLVYRYVTGKGSLDGTPGTENPGTAVNASTDLEDGGTVTDISSWSSKTGSKLGDDTYDVWYVTLSASDGTVQGYAYDES